MLSFDRCNCFVAARKRRSGFFLPFFFVFPLFLPPFPTTSRQRRYITRLRSRSEKTRPKRIGSVNSFFKSQLSFFACSNLLTVDRSVPVSRREEKGRERKSTTSFEINDIIEDSLITTMTYFNSKRRKRRKFVEMGEKRKVLSVFRSVEWREEEKLVHSREQVTLLARKIRRRETFSPSPREGRYLKSR